MKTMFVRNLAPETREEEVRELFSECGTVRGIKLSMDVFSGKCRGFATIDMEGHEARAAIARLNGRMLNGKAIAVAEERPKGKRKGPRR